MILMNARDLITKRARRCISWIAVMKLDIRGSHASYRKYLLAVLHDKGAFLKA